MPTLVYFAAGQPGGEGDYLVATEQELLDFANDVREAGGANMIPALFPARQSIPNQCLIAKALNFECDVDGIDGAWASGSQKWGMRASLPAAEAVVVAEKLGLEFRLDSADDYGYAGHYIVVPEHIGNAAMAFDKGLAFNKYALRY